jgi:CubicO group peptidase (beta-lactamase class C family)
MLDFRSLLITVCLTSVICLLLFSSPNKNINKNIAPSIFLSTIDDVVRDEMAKQEIVGCAVAVVENGRIVHVNGYGHTSPSRTTAITINTLFRWASVSKPLTAVAAFKVIENGRLSLTDKVVDKVSYWPSDGNKDDITVANLLNHRSGIIHYDDGSFNPFAYLSSNNFNAEQCVNVFKGTDLSFVPGTQHQYSTFGYNLLGAVIEEASGIPYERFVLDSIAVIGGLTSLTPYSNDPGGWGKNCNGWLEAKTEPFSVEYKLPAGGWASNIQGMAAFVNGLAQGTFLRNTSALWNNVPNNSRYRFGLRKNEVDGELYVFHNGAHEDVRTYMGLYPGEGTKLGVVVMINGNGSVDQDRLAHRIEEAMGKNRSISTQNPINYCGENNDCGNKTVGVWRQTNQTVDNIIRRGYTDEDFLAEWRHLKEAGFECIDFETYVDGITRKWDGIFKKTNNRSKIWFNAGEDGFLEKWRENRNEGYTLTDIETYMDGFTRRWAGLFVKSNESQNIQRNMTRASLKSRFDALGAEGMRLVDIEYNDGKWVGIWRPGTKTAYHTNLSAARFREIRLQYNTQGKRLIDVETYMVGFDRMWAGIWERSNQNEKFVYGKKYCEFLKLYHTPNQNDGYELIDFETY